MCVSFCLINIILHNNNNRDDLLCNHINDDKLKIKKLPGFDNATFFFVVFLNVFDIKE